MVPAKTVLTKTVYQSPYCLLWSLVAGIYANKWLFQQQKYWDTWNTQHHDLREGLEDGKEMRLSRLTRLALSPRKDCADFFWHCEAGDWLAEMDSTVSVLTDASEDMLSMLTNCSMPLKFHASCLVTVSAVGSIKHQQHCSFSSWKNASFVQPATIIHNAEDTSLLYITAILT